MCDALAYTYSHHSTYKTLLLLLCTYWRHKDLNKLLFVASHSSDPNNRVVCVCGTQKIINMYALYVCWIFNTVCIKFRLEKCLRKRAQCTFRVWKNEIFSPHNFLFRCALSQQRCDWLWSFWFQCSFSLFCSFFHTISSFIYMYMYMHLACTLHSVNRTTNVPHGEIWV